MLAIATVFGCQNADESHVESIKPAKIETLPVETDLARLTLSEDADRRLGIVTVAVVERDVIRRRTLGGQAVVPTGKTIVVSAPLAGIVMPTGDHALPTPGTRVESGTPLLSLTPLLSAERDVMTPAEQVQLIGARANLMAAQTVAAGDVDRGQAEVEGAKIAFDRATTLFADRAGARRAVDDAEAQLNVAQANLLAAQQRQSQLTELLQMLEVQAPDGEATALPMTTPISGLVNRMDVNVGQTVASGAVLFEVVNLDVIWIRVPVFVDQLQEVRTEQAASLVSLSSEPLPHVISANPVVAPPTADALNSSADLYYEVDNRVLQLRPGQRIGVEIPLSNTETSLVVPSGAILYDIYGNTWLYIETGVRQYTRRRVAVRFIDGADAVLSNGPVAGTRVVVDGAAELFGTEFGAGK